MIYIFDLDGTLIDSAERHLILLNNLLDKYGFSHLTDKTMQFIEYKANGYSTKQYLSQVLKMDDEMIKLINSEWISHIEDEQLIKYDRLYPESGNILEKLCKTNMIIYVSSRKNSQNVINEIKALGIDRYASHFYISDPGLGAEGKSELFQKIINSTDEKILVVGDTEVDYQAAKKNDLDSYILNRGFRSKEFWDRLNIQSHSDLYGLLGE